MANFLHMLIYMDLILVHPQCVICDLEWKLLSILFGVVTRPNNVGTWRLLMYELWVN